MTDEKIEQEIQAKGLTAARVTPKDVEDSIAEENYFSAGDGIFGAWYGTDKGPREAHNDALNGITFCVMVLKNGHRIVGINTGPVSPENFDAELGKKLARQNAIDQIWPLLGYALREKLMPKPQSTFVGPM